MSYHEHSRKTFVAAGAIPQDALVKLTELGVAVCGEGEQPLGVTEVGVNVPGDPVSVRMMNSSGTMEVVARSPVNRGQWLTSAENGAVATHAEGKPVVGMALHNAVADAMLEIVPTFCPVSVLALATEAGA